MAEWMNFLQYNSFVNRWCMITFFKCKTGAIVCTSATRSYDRLAGIQNSAKLKKINYILDKIFELFGV